MAPVLLSLAASSCWGIADFVGGLQSKRVAVPLVLALVDGTGLVLVLVVIAVVGEPLPGARAVVLALVGGVGGVLALAAALGFGSYFVLSDAAADDSVLWLLALSRAIPVPALLGLARWRGMPMPAARPALLLGAAGTLDCGATGLYAVANTKGALSIVAVVGSLYPVATLVLARMVLGERIRPVQRAGVAAALAGVALIAGG